MNTTRRQFLTTLGSAVVAVPLAAALPGMAAPKPPVVAYPPRALEWHVRYAQFVAMGLQGNLLMVESRFGKNPICRDHFVVGNTIVEPEKHLVRCQDVVWVSSVKVSESGSQEGTLWDRKVHGELLVEATTWREKSPEKCEEWIRSIRYIVRWESLAEGAPSWNQGSVVPHSLFPT